MCIIYLLLLAQSFIVTHSLNVFAMEHLHITCHLIYRDVCLRRKKYSECKYTTIYIVDKYVAHYRIRVQLLPEGLMVWYHFLLSPPLPPSLNSLPLSPSLSVSLSRSLSPSIAPLASLSLSFPLSHLFSLFGFFQDFPTNDPNVFRFGNSTLVHRDFR